jgi:hypothetical protein
MPDTGTARYCKDCTHFRVKERTAAEPGDIYECHASTDIDPGTGLPIVRFATDERDDGGTCGPRGDLWAEAA